MVSSTACYWVGPWFKSWQRRKSLILNKRTTTNLSCSVTNVNCVCVNIADKQYFKFGNSRFILGTETGREMASLEWAKIIRDGKWVFNAQDGKFPAFSGKNLVPKKRDRECRPLTHASFRLPNLALIYFCDLSHYF